jgi:hypothetical protein
MNRNHLGIAVVAAFALVIVALPVVAEDPPKLPLLPPPDKPVPLPNKPAELPPNATLVPVEFRLAITDLEKQLLRGFAQKIDPKAEPALPLVIKGNQTNFALGAADEKKDDGKQAGEGVADNGQAMHPVRPMLIPRQPGTHPRLDRLAQRPLVAGMVQAMLGNFDLTYRIELRSIKLSVTGNTLTCEMGAGFYCEGKPAVQPAAVPAPPPAPNVRDISLKLKVIKSLEWNEKGKLELKEGSSSVWIDPEAPVVGFPRLDIERIVRLNGMLALMGGTVDRELMKFLTGENLPDLAVIAPSLKQKMPLLAVSELTAYPIRGDDKNIYLPFVVGLVSAKKKTDDVIIISTKPGPAPEPKVKGKIVFDKDGKPEVKIEAAP